MPTVNNPTTTGIDAALDAVMDDHDGQNEWQPPPTKAGEKGPVGRRQKARMCKAAPGTVTA